jgi:uncharacterized protein with NAD-binding domain and iron-sulfur cluster
MAAAFELTRPELAGRYEVTVYQTGWRLGGKGASGRGPADRIEEHGLHLWMGFYENAFRLMRECYEELDRDPATCRIASWQDAFVPDPFLGVTEKSSGGEWVFWKAHLPPAPGLPGDAYPRGARWSVADYMARGVALLRTLFESLAVGDRVRPAPAAAAAGGGGALGSPPRASVPPGTPEPIARFLRYGELATLAALLEAVRVLETVMAAVPGFPDNAIVRFLDAIATNARSQLQVLLDTDDEVRRLWTIIDLTLATLRGMVRFGLATDPRGFEVIDDYDCREWLLLNGASQQSVDSGYLRGLYDLGFSYEDGDAGKPRIAAGQALRAMFRAFFTYRGAFFWKMQSGMGDVVFAPLYQVLKRRGVRFEFFHRLENIRLADASSLGAGERPYVEALEFDVQARTLGGREYEPLIEVRDLPCWPATPVYSQLEHGDRLRREGWNFESFWDRRRDSARTLRVGRDFDMVVLGVGVGAIPHVGRELVARDPRWRAMVDHVKTVATQAFQVWLSADMKDLGWGEPPINVSGFVDPFDTWADMRHLIDEESWPRRPLSLAYFCNVLPDLAAPDDRSRPEYLELQRVRVKENAIRFLNRDVVHLWPNAVRARGEFRWDLLVDPEAAGAAAAGAFAAGASAAASERGAERFDSQFWTANVNPSDRYALSLPGSLTYRISPLDDTYDNLTIAGDWTDCGFNAGCVEAAVMSGRLAAHAISLSPPLEEIVGFDHP